MRIGVNTLFLIPGEVGGSETYVRDVLTHAVPASPDIEWVLFTNEENHEPLGKVFDFPGKVSRCNLGFKARCRHQRIIREQLQLPRRVAHERIDVLWSPGYTAPGWVGCPQVVSILDMQYKAFPQDLSRMALLATRVLVPLAARRADHVLTLSEFSRREILAHIGIPAAKVQVVYPAVDPAFGRALGGREAAGMVLPASPYVLCVANTYPHKNVAALVQAVDMAGRDRLLNLVLVGIEGRGEADVRRAVEAMRHPNRVIRLSRLSRLELATLYQHAAVFAFPSLYEGFGLPVLEAMAAGAPVVTTRCGSIPEVGGDCVRYFDGTAGALARCLNELLDLAPEQRRGMVEEARLRAATFSWQRAANEIVDCLRRQVAPDPASV